MASTSEPGAYERLANFATAAQFYIEAFEAHERAPTRYTSLAMIERRTAYAVAKKALGDIWGPEDWNDERL